MKTTSIRIHEDDLKKIKELDINLGELVREIVKQTIKTKQCPICGCRKGEVKNEKRNI